MGNCNFVHIITNGLSYYPGDLIQGDVYVKVLTPIPAQRLMLKLVGTESTDFIENTNLQSMSNVLCTYEKELFCWPHKETEPGDYVFQFSFYLPNDLPGCTSLDLLFIKANITYALTAYISKELESSVELQVRQLCSSDQLTNTVRSDIAIPSCFCLRKRLSKVVIEANKHEYTCEEVVKVQIHKEKNQEQRYLINFFRTIMVSGGSGHVKISKDIIMQVETAENFLDIDLKSIENRLENKYTTTGKYVCCMYSLNFLPIPINFCTTNTEAVLHINIVPKGTIPIIPRCSISWVPKIIRESTSDPNEDSIIINLL